MLSRASGRWWWSKQVMKGGDNKKGPNDASGIVWAISKFLFIFFHVCLILTIIFR